MASSLSCLECGNWIEDVKVSGYWSCEKCWDKAIKMGEQEEHDMQTRKRKRKLKRI